MHDPPLPLFQKLIYSLFDFSFFESLNLLNSCGMRLGIVGNGKTSKVIQKLAPLYGFEICSIADSKTPLDLSQIEVCIDFSSREGTLQTLPKCIKKNIPVVVGTTNWNDQISSMQALTKKHQATVMFCPNFSLGIALMTKILQQTLPLFATFPNYVISGHERHHKDKKDAPSGTAKALSAAFNIPFTFERIEEHFGQHTITIRSQFDTIEISHKAHSREGYALGALLAAKWLIDKKGWYTFDDWLNSIHSIDHPI